MPLDDTTRSNAKRLSSILRDRSQWPGDFVWDYGELDCCAVELGCREFGISRAICDASDMLGVAIGLTPAQSEVVFFGAGARNHQAIRTVTPEQVADLIDAYTT